MEFEAVYYLEVRKKYLPLISWREVAQFSNRDTGLEAMVCYIADNRINQRFCRLRRVWKVSTKNTTTTKTP